MLHISGRPVATFCIDQPLCDGPRIRFGKLKRLKGSIRVGIDTDNQS